MRQIVREETRRSKANGDENLYVKIQDMICQAYSALVPSVNADSGISLPLASIRSPLANLTILSGLSESSGPSNLAFYPLFVHNNHRERQPVHLYRLKLANKKSVMKREPNIYQILPLEEDKNKSESYRYSDEMILGTWFIDLFPEEKEKDINMKLVDIFQSKFPLILSNSFKFSVRISVIVIGNTSKCDFMLFKRN